MKAFPWAKRFSQSLKGISISMKKKIYRIIVKKKWCSALFKYTTLLVIQLSSIPLTYQKGNWSSWRLSSVSKVIHSVKEYRAPYTEQHIDPIYWYIIYRKTLDSDNNSTSFLDNPLECCNPCSCYRISSKCFLPPSSGARELFSFKF